MKNQFRFSLLGVMAVVIGLINVAQATDMAIPSALSIQAVYEARVRSLELEGAVIRWLTSKGSCGMLPARQLGQFRRLPRSAPSAGWGPR